MWRGVQRVALFVWGFRRAVVVYAVLAFVVVMLGESGLWGPGREATAAQTFGVCTLALVTAFLTGCWCVASSVTDSVSRLALALEARSGRPEREQYVAEMLPDAPERAESAENRKIL